MIRVLVVDDHAIVRSGVRRLLEPEAGIECLEAKSTEAALELIEREPVDIVVFDLNLPGLGGPEAIRTLLKGRPGMRVLVFSTHAEPVYVAKSLEAGASGYVSKNAAPEDLTRAIRAIARGSTFIEAEIAEEMSARGAEGSLQSLSSRELEMLRLLVRGQSLSQIAASLGVAYKTVANTCTHIKEKLGAGQIADLVRIALDSKLV